MHSSRVRAGAALLALFGGVFGIVSNYVAPPPPEAPPFAWWVGPVTGVLTLAGLALWWWGGSRVALWVVVVITVLSALLPLPDIATFDSSLMVLVIVGLALTVVAVVLLAPAMVRRRTSASEPV